MTMKRKSATNDRLYNATYYGWVRIYMRLLLRAKGKKMNDHEPECTFGPITTFPKKDCRECELILKIEDLSLAIYIRKNQINVYDAETRQMERELDKLRALNNGL
jgi:hypothetical protein